jgi:23S rRNA-/tRNA-specific pseudouridylate synthase
MNKHEEVVAACRQGMRFTWNLDGIKPFNPKGEPVHRLDGDVSGAVLWVLKHFAQKAVCNADATLSFEPTSDGLNIYYDEQK